MEQVLCLGTKLFEFKLRLCSLIENLFMIGLLYKQTEFFVRRSNET